VLVQRQALKLPRWFNLAFMRIYQDFNSTFDALEVIGVDRLR
jgi:hypothetical protein